jgi:hypothetical protein
LAVLEETGPSPAALSDLQAEEAKSKWSMSEMARGR